MTKEFLDKLNRIHQLGDAIVASQQIKYFVVLNEGYLVHESRVPKAIAEAVVTLALGGHTHIRGNAHERWTLWCDGVSVVAVALTEGVNLAKNSGRAIRRLLRLVRPDLKMNYEPNERELRLAASTLGTMPIGRL